MSDPARNEQKEALRRMAAQLPKVDAARLIERFLALDRVKNGKTFFLFYGMGKEPDTRPLIRALLEQGKRVALPVCLPGRGMEAREISSLAELEPGCFGIPQPAAACPVVTKGEIDVALVPGLLFDRSGHRLGHGGGYYDRWLAGYSGLIVSLCPPERLVDQLPTEPFDLPVDLVISE